MIPRSSAAGRSLFIQTRAYVLQGLNCSYSPFLMSYPFTCTSQGRLPFRPNTYTTFVEEATGRAGVQIGSQESGFGINTNTPENLNVSASDVDFQSTHNLGWLGGFEVASFGMGGGFTDTSPRSNSPNLLSDFSIINDYQHAQHNFNTFDESLRYESTSMLPFPYLNSGESKNTSDSASDVNELVSLPTSSELDVWLQIPESQSIEAFPSEHRATGEFISTPSDSAQDQESYSFEISGVSQGNSPSSSTVADHGPDSPRPFNCDAEGCSRSYRRIHELRRHKRVHSSTKPFACRFTNCKRSGQKGFTRKDHLKQHLRQVHGASL